MNNFKVNVIMDGTSRDVTVRYYKKESSEIKKNVSLDDDILHDLGLEKVSFKELVPKYEKVKYTNEENHCPICHMSYIKGEYKRKLNCNHEFHKKCLDKWLKDVLNCPICRKDLL